jgi:NADH-quinone oxidoreductase subunit M
MKLTLMLVGGSVLIWIGIFATFHEAGLGTFDLPRLWQAGEDGTLSPGFQKTFFPFMVIGCGVLAALWPFHTWSPDGHMSAPTAVSMVHAGVLMKLGAFGIIRLGIQLMPEGAAFWAPGLMVLGTIGAVYGATAALTQRDFKLISGYSSVSHMGYVLMGLATLNEIGLTGAVLQMFSHGVMTALVFLMTGEGDAALGDLLHDCRTGERWTAGLERVHGRVPHLRGHLPDVPVVRSAGYPRGRAGGGLHAAHVRDCVLWADESEMVVAA